MRRCLSILTVAVLSICSMASVAAASLVNVRPIIDPATGVPPLPSSATSELWSLQQIFSGSFAGIGSTIDVYNDQATPAIFRPNSPGISSTYVASVTWGNFLNTQVGLYKLGDPSTDLILLDAGVWTATEGQSISINFDFVNDVVVSYRIVGANPVLIDSQAGFGMNFGFFIDTQEYGRWYSEDSLNNTVNKSDNAQVLMFQSKSDVVSIGSNPPLNDYAHWYVAFEGQPNDGTLPFLEGQIDFNDFVLQMESIEPVPEPVTLCLLAVGSLGFLRRRK